MIHPVILCGGAGTRLWPLSRRDRPKQFAPLAGAESLFQATLTRFAGEGFAAPLLLTRTEFRFLAAEQAQAAGIAPAAILLEPSPRNTAPAVLAAALHLAATAGPEAVMLAAPSDHAIADETAFRAALQAGAAAAAGGALVTFGIRPDRAETGYGWLELDDDAGTAEAGATRATGVGATGATGAAGASAAAGTAGAAGCTPTAAGTEAAGGFAARPLRRFVEKPDADRAAEMLAAGQFLWNAGLFMARADRFIAAFEAHAPEIVGPVRAALDGAVRDLDFLRLAPGPWQNAPEISLDYAVMERAAGDGATRAVAVAVACGWSDLGVWDAVWRAMDPDARGVATAGPVTEIGCRDTLLRADGADAPRLVGVGLDGLAVVAMRDAVLVADKAAPQAVRAAVAAMQAGGVAEAEAMPLVHRPWGGYETLAAGPRFQVKRIRVRPGGKLSLQSHLHRAEHWVVVQGTAAVTIDEETRLLSENQSVYVPLGAVHRLENPGRVELHLIEVQTGTYLGEDDIRRFDDVYNRS